MSGLLHEIALIVVLRICRLIGVRTWYGNRTQSCVDKLWLIYVTFDVVMHKIIVGNTYLA